MTNPWEALGVEPPAEGTLRPRPRPIVDRRRVAKEHGEGVVRAYEASRGATLIDTSAGYSRVLRDVLAELGCAVPSPPSADFVSRTEDELRRRRDV